MDSILVIGGGSWGTAFADYLARQEQGVRIWVREPEVLDAIRSGRENRVFLPGIELAPGLEAGADLEGEAGRARILVLAVPSKFIRSVMRRLQRRAPRGPRPGQPLQGLRIRFAQDHLAGGGRGIRPRHLPAVADPFRALFRPRAGQRPPHGRGRRIGQRGAARAAAGAAFRRRPCASTAPPTCAAWKWPGR